MIPNRQKLIGENKVVEYYLEWVDGPWTFINGKVVRGTYDQAVARLEREA